MILMIGTGSMLSDILDWGLHIWYTLLIFNW